MLNNLSVIITFKIINFLIIIFVFVYLFKKYLYISLKANILKYKNYFSGLRNSVDDKIALLNQLDLDILKQKESNNRLLEKVRIWNLEYSKKQQEKIALMSQNALKMQENYKIQQEYLVMQTLNKELLKDVIKEVEYKIIDEFSEKHSVEQFQNTLISQLE